MVYAMNSYHMWAVTVQPNRHSFSSTCHDSRTITTKSTLDLDILREFVCKKLSIASSIVSALPFLISCICKKDVFTPLSLILYLPTSTNCFNTAMSLDSSKKSNYWHCISNRIFSSITDDKQWSNSEIVCSLVY